MTDKKLPEEVTKQLSEWGKKGARALTFDQRSKGGKAAAKKLGKRGTSERAKKAVAARWKKWREEYGS